jgi:small subunit ribosomal protein S16
MIVIRLQRTGRRNLASYRIVVAEKERSAKGKYLEIVGHYLPQRTPAVFEVRKERILEWVKNGAIPSDTAARLLKNNGVQGMERYIIRYAKRKPKDSAQSDEPSAAPAEAATAKPAAAPDAAQAAA